MDSIVEIDPTGQTYWRNEKIMKEIKENNAKIKEMIVMEKKNEESLKTFQEENINLKALKEELKDIKKFDRYLDKCKISKENFELVNYVDSGSESNVFSINILYKNKNGHKMKKNYNEKYILSKK